MTGRARRPQAIDLPKSSRESGRGHCPRPTPSARAPGRAASLRALQDPSRRCAPSMFELEKKGIIQRIPEPRRHRARSHAEGGQGDLCGPRGARGDGRPYLPFPVAKSDTIGSLRSSESTARRSTPATCLRFSTAICIFIRCCSACARNTCLIEAIELLAQKTYGIRSYANAFPEALDQARRDHVEMIEALRASRRDDLIALARRQLQTFVEAYIRVTNVASATAIRRSYPPRNSIRATQTPRRGKT